MLDMELLDNMYNEGRFREVAEAIEALPRESRGPELDSRLSAAYTELGLREDSPELLDKAIDALRRHETELAESADWNMAMGRAYMRRKNVGEAFAMRYFLKARELEPENAEAASLIESLRGPISLPRYGGRPFSLRVKEAWAEFARSEGYFRRLLAEPDREAVGAELISAIRAVLRIAFYDIAFEIGIDGGRPELILAIEASRASLLEIAYFAHNAPASVLDIWNIHIGRKRTALPTINIRSLGTRMTSDDVYISARRNGEGHLDFEAYCEKLMPMWETRRRSVQWLLGNMIDLSMGEAAAMRFTGSFRACPEPPEGSFIMTELPERLKSLGVDLDEDHLEALINGLTPYEAKPKGDPAGVPRADIFVGRTRLPSLINGYFAGSFRTFEEFYSDGVTAGFIFFPVESFRSLPDPGKAILDFLDSLARNLTRRAGSHAFAYMGGATGTRFAYLDLLAWDLTPVLDAAQIFFCAHPEISAAHFRTFHRFSGLIQLAPPTGGKK